MEELDFWKICDSLTVKQATLLTLGHNPEKYQNTTTSIFPTGYIAIFSALKKAVESNKIEAKIKYNDSDNSSINWDTTELDLESIRKWILPKNISNNTFFETSSNKHLNFMFPWHEYFPPKLRTAHHAWSLVTGHPELLIGKTPKQALEKWIRERADLYDLLKEDGSYNETAIEEIVKVANWKPEGGVAKTASQVQSNLPTPLNEIES